VEFALNQQHIADNLELSLVHTNKTMRRLRLPNTKALERIADYFDKPPRKVPRL
jgi:CRP/FNR family transcriptional regulator, anaerobic regulatory protein